MYTFGGGIMDKSQWIRRIISTVTAAGVLAAASALPAETWTAVGRSAALASISLQQADALAAAISQSLTREEAVSGEGSGDKQYAAGDLQLSEPQGADQTPLTEPTAPVAGTPTPPPPENGSGGKIVSQQVGGGNMVGGIAVKNKSGVTVDIPSALQSALPFTVEVGSKEPQVLIYHTHTTEGYMPYDAGYYNDGDIERTPEYPHNVTLVGDALEAELTAAGIGVIHVTEIYDYPSYRGAYERSVVMMEEMLRKYPSIKITIDIHRDGLMANTTDKLKPTVTVDGKKAAQMMVVCGVLTTDALPHPNWRQNLAFAAQLQKQLSSDHAGLMRPLSLTGARYNQYITTGSLLIEVGSEGNTLDEAVYSAHLLGKSLVSLLGAAS